MRALVDEASAKAAAHEETSAYAHRAHAFATALQESSHTELSQWSSLVDQYAVRLDAMGTVLAASQQETAQLRSQNTELHEQNELLREHCEQLRRLVIDAGIATAAPRA